MSRKVYTLGYSGRKPEQLLALLEDLDAVCFDIRLSARSMVPGWNKGPLSRLLGARYVHVPALGNLAYKTGGPIQIADYAAGKALIEASEKPVVLMCGCKDASLCHRSQVGAQLVAEGFEVVELPLRPTQPPKPVMLQLFLL